MSTSRRNVIIRSVASLAGDIAVGVTVANVCIWAIQAATLGLFLSFLVWLVGALLSLALSQFVVHPAVKVLLSDRKLDAGLDALSGLAFGLDTLGGEAVDGAMRFAKSAWSRMRPAT
jgi:hypothetical protein